MSPMPCAGVGDDWPFETFPQYLDALEARQRGHALFGHTPLRLYVMGEEATERAATPDDREDEIAGARAMDAGAIGFGKLASITQRICRQAGARRQATVEKRTLASVMGELKRGLMQVTIGKAFSTRGDGCAASTACRSPGRRCCPIYGPGGHCRQLDLAAEQRRNGAVVIPQVSCRPSEFTFGEPFDVMKMMVELSAEETRSPGAGARLSRQGMASTLYRRTAPVFRTRIAR